MAASPPPPMLAPRRMTAMRTGQGGRRWVHRLYRDAPPGGRGGGRSDGAASAGRRARCWSGSARRKNRATGGARRGQFARIGIGMALCALLIVLVAAQISAHRGAATMAANGQARAQERSPAVDAASLEAALDLGPVTGRVCTAQANGTPA